MMSDNGIERRRFLNRVAGAGVVAAGSWMRPSPAQSAIAVSEDALPTVQLGKKRVTRLIVGGNPIGGFSYGTAKLTKHMLSYFTVERTTEFLLHCEKQGITTFQCNYSKVVRDALLAARERGSKIQFILLGGGLSEGHT